MEQTHNSYLYVDRNALRSNVKSILARIGTAQLIPVLKSDAFGLGLVPVAQTMAEFPQIQTIAAAHVSEGLELRGAGIDRDILIIGNALPRQLPYAVATGLTLTAARVGFLRELELATAGLGLTAKVQIKLDTGLHRIGVEPGEELAALLCELKSTSHLVVTGTFSHFADGFDATRTQGQYECFMRGIEQIKAAGIEPGMLHISCSASSELYPQYNLDAVRIGRGLFMDNPLKPLGNLQEVASWRAAVTLIKPRHKGDRLGYGEGVALKKDSMVASISVGYGDGLDPALATAGACVLIKGALCPLIYCSMDQSLADVSSVECAVGDEVTIFGHSSSGEYLSSQAQAALIGGNEGCGLTAALAKRVERVY